MASIIYIQALLAKNQRPAMLHRCSTLTVSNQRPVLQARLQTSQAEGEAACMLFHSSGNQMRLLMHSICLDPQ